MTPRRRPARAHLRAPARSAPWTDAHSPALHVFGHPDPDHLALLGALVDTVTDLPVPRLGPARSSKPYPTSNDLERALEPHLEAAGFLHHHDLHHPTTHQRFEYDFWHPDRGIAVEITGYRADDEIYKDILRFHVHPATDLGVVWVPRWKWIGARKTSTNHDAVLKALTFADTFMSVGALVAIPYDWLPDHTHPWRLAFPSTMLPMAPNPTPM